MSTLDRIYKVLWPNGASAFTKAKPSGEIIAPDVGPADGAKGNVAVRTAKPKKKKKKPSTLAKRAITSGVTGKSSAYFYSALQKRATKIKAEGETDAAAMTRAMTEDDKGKAFYSAMRVAASGVEKMAPVDDSPAAEAENVVGFKSRAEAELDRLAKQRLKANPSLTYAAAYAEIFSLPENKALRDAVRNDGLIREMRGQGGVI